MVRMGRGNESLLVPFVDSKGSFGKAYSRDMSCAAARYTEEMCIIDRSNRPALKSSMTATFSLGFSLPCISPTRRSGSSVFFSSEAT